MAECSDHPCIFVVVEAAREHLLSKRHEIGSGCKVPQLVSPESAGLAHTCLHFIHDKVDVVLFGYVLKALSEFVRELIVATFTHDWLDYDCAHFGILCLPLSHLGPHICKRGLVLLLVVLNVVNERVLVPRRLSGWPVKGGEAKLVQGVRSCGRHCSEQTSMES